MVIGEVTLSWHDFEVFVYVYVYSCVGGDGHMGM